MSPAIADHSTNALPRLVPSPAGSGNCGYRRDYEMHAHLGRCLLQRVRVHIHYYCGGERLADYRQTYYEFFRFDDDDKALVDTHDFDLARDGWRQSVIVGLVQQHHRSDLPIPGGEPAVLVKKQFLLARGHTQNAAPRELAPGASFGLLANGPDGPSRTTLRLARGDGSWATIDTLPPCPAGYRVQGSGSFISSSGFTTFECYRYRFANLTGRFFDSGSYRPQRIQT